MKIVITITDLPNGKVEVKSDPSFETMMKMIDSGTEPTSAMGYAIYALRKIKEEAKSMGSTKILIPRIGRL